MEHYASDKPNHDFFTKSPSKESFSLEQNLLKPIPSKLLLLLTIYQNCWKLVKKLSSYQATTCFDAHRDGSKTFYPHKMLHGV